MGEKVGVDRLQPGVMRLYQVQHLLVLGLLGKKQTGHRTAVCSGMLHVITHMGAGDSSVVRTLDS